MILNRPSSRLDALQSSDRDKLIPFTIKYNYQTDTYKYITSGVLDFIYANRYLTLIPLEIVILIIY